MGGGGAPHAGERPGAKGEWPGEAPCGEEGRPFIAGGTAPTWGRREFSPARYGGTGRESWWRLLRLPEQVGQLGRDVDEVALLALGDDRVGPRQEVGDLLDRRLEVGLAERRRELDVQDAARCAVGGAGGRPDHDVAEALAALDAQGQQVPREDPLDRLIEADVER